MLKGTLNNCKIVTTKHAAFWVYKNLVIVRINGAKDDSLVGVMESINTDLIKRYILVASTLLQSDNSKPVNVKQEIMAGIVVGFWIQLPLSCSVRKVREEIQQKSPTLLQLTHY